MSRAAGTESCGKTWMTLGYSCQFQGSLPSVADSGHEQSTSALFTTMFPTWDRTLSAGRSCSSSIHAPAHPKRALLGTSPQAALAKFTVPSSPGSVPGCKSQSNSKLQDLLQDQSQRRRHRVWVLIEVSPPQVPSRHAWPAVSRLQQLRQGGDGGKDAHKALRYPVLQAGKGARRVCEGRRGAGPAQQLAPPQGGGVKGLRGNPGGSPDQPGFGKWTLGRHRSDKPTPPKVSAGFNTVRDTPEWGHRCHPTRAPSALAKANPLPAQPHGCEHPSRQGKHHCQPRTACPCSHLGLTHLLLLIPRARVPQEAPLHPM